MTDIANRCERCDHAECDVPAARANLEAFKNGRLAEPGYDDAIARNRKAHDDCAARPAVDWRDEALALRARIGEVERERDEARQSLDILRALMPNTARLADERDSALSRLAAIAAVVEPVAEMAEGATPGRLFVTGSTVYALNATGTNRIYCAVASGHDDNGERVSLHEIERTAELFVAAVNLVPTLRGMVKGDSNE